MRYIANERPLLIGYRRKRLWPVLLACALAGIMSGVGVSVAAAAFWAIMV